MTLFSALLRVQKAKMLPIYTLKPILRKKLLIGYQWVEYLTALTILNGDWPRLILISVFVHANMQCLFYIYIYIYEYVFFGFPWVERLAVRIALRSVVPPRPSRGIEKCHILQCSVIIITTADRNGCHQSKRKNTLFKQFSSDCGITRFRAYQTLIYIMWALRLTPIYHWFFFRNSEKCIDSISSHCAINDLMNYVKLFSLIVLKNQCKIAELCVYRFKTAVIICIHITTWSCIISMLDSYTISKPWV